MVWKYMLLCARARSFIYIIIAYRDTLSRQFVGEVERGAFHVVRHVCVSLKSGGSGRVAGHATDDTFRAGSGESVRGKGTACDVACGNVGQAHGLWAQRLRVLHYHEPVNSRKANDAADGLVVFVRADEWEDTNSVQAVAFKDSQRSGGEGHADHYGARAGCLAGYVLQKAVLCDVLTSQGVEVRHATAGPALEDEDVPLFCQRRS